MLKTSDFIKKENSSETCKSATIIKGYTININIKNKKCQNNLKS